MAPFFLSARNNPARTTDDLPLPDGPTTTINRAPSLTFATICPISVRRPKKNSALPSSNAASPR